MRVGEASQALAFQGLGAPARIRDSDVQGVVNPNLNRAPENAAGRPSENASRLPESTEPNAMPLLGNRASTA